MAALAKAKVTAACFADDEAREAYAILRKHHARHGVLPSWAVIADLAAVFHRIPTADPLASLIERVKEKELYNGLMASLRDVTTTAPTDARAALAALRAAGEKLSAQHVATDGLDAARDAAAVRARYDRAKDAKGMLGLAWPWPYWNEVTLGLQPGDYVVFYAQPASYKSWLLCYLATHLHRSLGETPLFVTLEMPPAAIHARIGALYAGVAWSDYRRGRLTPHDERRLDAALAAMADGPPFPITRVSGRGAEAIAELRALIEEHRPAVVYFDGLYQLAEGAEWQSMATVNAGVKQLALDTGVAFVCTSQESNAGRVNWKSFEQYADVLALLESGPDYKAARELKMLFKKVREAEARDMLIHCIPAGNFAQKAVLDAPGAAGGADLKDDASGELGEAAKEGVTNGAGVGAG